MSKKNLDKQIPPMQEADKKIKKQPSKVSIAAQWLLGAPLESQPQSPRKPLNKTGSKIEPPKLKG